MNIPYTISVIPHIKLRTMFREMPDEVCLNASGVIRRHEIWTRNSQYDYRIFVKENTNEY